MLIKTTDNIHGLKVIHAKRYLTDEQMDERVGMLMVREDVDIVLGDESALVLKSDGSPLLVYLKGVLNSHDCEMAYNNLKGAAQSSNNRGIAGGVGMMDDEKAGEQTATRFRPTKKDGTVSNTLYAKGGGTAATYGMQTRFKRTDGTTTKPQARDVKSGIIGHFDRSARFPYCRLTAFNLNEPEKFNAALPFIRSVNEVFRKYAPDRYAAQQEVIEMTEKDFYISGTAFTTITVNMNWQTAIHKDVGDYKEGFGVMSMMRAGRYDGCYTSFPAFRVGADMQTGDVMLADVHEWHGNTPIYPKGSYERLACVFYYRAKMFECEPASEELLRAKRLRGASHVE